MLGSPAAARSDRVRSIEITATASTTTRSDTVRGAWWTMTRRSPAPTARAPGWRRSAAAAHGRRKTARDRFRSKPDAQALAGPIPPLRVRSTRLGRDVAAMLRADHAGLVLDNVIRENVRVAEAYAGASP